MKYRWFLAGLCAVELWRTFAVNECRADDTNRPAHLPNAARVTLSPEYLNELSSALRTNHPALRALEARQRAAQHTVDGVRTWENPMVRFGGVIATDRGSNLSEDGDLVYSLEQKVPLFGRASAERRLASREAATSVARAELQFQIYRRDLARLLLAAALADANLEIGERDLEWLKTMAATIDARYQAGASSQIELLRIQNERARRADLLTTDRRLREHNWVSIHRLLNRPATTNATVLSLPDLWPEIPISADGFLAAQAHHSEPTLRLMTSETEAAEAQVAATRKSVWPDVFAGIEGRQYSGDGNFREGMFSVGLSLPWLNRAHYRSDIARDRARLEAAQLDRANEELQIREDIHRLLIEVDSARREATLLRDEILPRSRQAMESARANWTVGRSPFMEMMEARRLILESELNLARATARQFEALSDLVLRCGLPDLNALQNLRSEKLTP